MPTWVAEAREAERVGLGDVERGAVLEITVDGERIRAYDGETVAAALIASGRRVFRLSRGEDPRGFYCGMGVCFDCLVTVDEQRNTRACMTYVHQDMSVERQKEWRPDATAFR
jgi:predicted molibdopterin-dependent oxidoreductase YjgC